MRWPSYTMSTASIVMTVLHRQKVHFPAMSLSSVSNSGTATLRFAEPCELSCFFSGSTLAEAQETVVHSQSRAPMRTAGFSALDAKAAGANKCHPAAPPYWD